MKMERSMPNDIRKPSERSNLKNNASNSKIMPRKDDPKQPYRHCIRLNKEAKAIRKTKSKPNIYLLENSAFLDPWE